MSIAQTKLAAEMENIYYYGIAHQLRNKIYKPQESAASQFRKLRVSLR